MAGWSIAFDTPITVRAMFVAAIAQAQLSVAAAGTLAA
jgi:hypothetical protein